VRLNNLANLKYGTPPLGGLKKDLPSQLLARHFSPDLNAVWVHNGQVQRMPGMQKFATQLDTGSVQGIYQFEMDDGSDIVLGATKTKVYKIDATGLQYVTVNTGDRITVGPDDDYVTVGEGELGWTSIHDGTDFTGGNADFVDMISFFDSSGAEICVIGNGVDENRKWTGTGNISTLAGSPPKTKYFEVYKNYLVNLYTVESGTAYPRRVRFSALGNGESYPAAYKIGFHNTTDAIVGGKTIRDQLAVFKEKSISLVSYVGGALIWNTKENYIGSHGALSHRAIQKWGKNQELLFYIGSDYEIYNFDGVVEQALSGNIKNKLLGVHPGYTKYACSVKAEEYDKVLWAFPGSDKEGCYDLLVYDVKLGSWWIKENYPVRISTLSMARRGSSITWDNLSYSSWDTFKVDGGWDAIGSSEEEPVILLGCGDGYARYFVAGEDDDGTDIPSHFTYPFDNLNGDDEQLKLLTKIFVETSGGNTSTIRVRVFTNDNDTDPRSLDDSGNTYKTITLEPTDTNRNFQVTEVDVNVIGYNFSVKIEADNYFWGGRVVKMDYNVIGKGIH
jgi:hypothetical protein